MENKKEAKEAKFLSPKNLETWQPRKPEQMPSDWWKEFVEGIHEVDGGPYKEFAEKAVKTALEILDSKIQCQIIFVDTLPESTGLGANLFCWETCDRAVILINQPELDKEKIKDKGKKAINICNLLTMIAFHEARHIKQHEVMLQYWRILDWAQFMRVTYQTALKEFKETRGIRMEESQARIEKWIAENNNYIPCPGEDYYTQDSEMDARSFERVLTKALTGVEDDEYWPGEKRRTTEMTKRYGEKAKQRMPEIWTALEEVYLTAIGKKRKETA